MSLQHVTDQVADHLDKIKSYFKPGVKVTILVRHQDDAQGRLDFVMTDDDPAQAISMLARRMAAGRTA